MENQASRAMSPLSPDAQVLTGRCHCGAVTYRAAGPVAECNHCGCPSCRRATGALAVPFVRVPRSGFSFTSGEPATHEAAEGEGCDGCDAHGAWHFCPRCGTQIVWMGRKEDLADVFAGTLDDWSVFRPSAKAEQSQ